MNKKYKVGVIGATGMVGQRFVSLWMVAPSLSYCGFGKPPREAGGSRRVHEWWLIESPLL
jgi:aspartate-semialdehyde dehydrogenase